MRRLAFLAVLAVVVLSVVGVALWLGGARSAFVAHGPLPPPPSGPLTFAGSPPQHPFHKEAVNAFTRTIFEADGPGNSRIEVRDLLIPPHGKTELSALPGPAVVELATGSVTISLGEKPQTLGGAMRSLPAGTSAGVENSGPSPAMLRLYIIRAR